MTNQQNLKETAGLRQGLVIALAAHPEFRLRTESLLPKSATEGTKQYKSLNCGALGQFLAKEGKSMVCNY